jgi:hypothetical protein
MIDYGKLYDEFLYDCYIANQRLTDEDWIYYGKEKHHIEIPARDEGVLTPLNSQPLTTYQHWIAGVLQSEVLGKCCFAFVPKGALPAELETLRIKWEILKFTPEQRRERMLKGLTNRTPEEKSAAAIKSNLNRTPEVVAETARRMVAARTPEGHRRGALNRWANTTPEQRREHARKSAETRRRNKQGG